MNNIPDNWHDLEPIYIFMLGIIATYPPYDEMTPKDVWDDICKKFRELERDVT